MRLLSFVKDKVLIYLVVGHCALVVLNVELLLIIR